MPKITVLGQSILRLAPSVDHGNGHFSDTKFPKKSVLFDIFSDKLKTLLENLFLGYGGAGDISTLIVVVCLQQLMLLLVVLLT